MDTIAKICFNISWAAIALTCLFGTRGLYEEWSARIILAVVAPGAFILLATIFGSLLSIPVLMIFGMFMDRKAIPFEIITSVLLMVLSLFGCWALVALSRKEKTKKATPPPKTDLAR